MKIMSMFNLKGKKDVITGGVGILGSSIAKGLDEESEIDICRIIRSGWGIINI